MVWVHVLLCSFREHSYDSQHTSSDVSRSAPRELDSQSHSSGVSSPHAHGVHPVRPLFKHRVGLVQWVWLWATLPFIHSGAQMCRTTKCSWTISHTYRLRQFRFHLWNISLTFDGCSVAPFQRRMGVTVPLTLAATRLCCASGYI